MRILTVIGGFFPAEKCGGPTISVDNFVKLLNDQEHYIVTRDHDWKVSTRLEGIKEGWNDYSQNCRVLYLQDKQQNVRIYRNLIKDIKPDLIYLNDFYLVQDVIPTLQAARMEGTPILAAPRGGLCKNAMDIKKLKKYVYAFGMSFYMDKKHTMFQSTSDEETERIQRLLRVRADRIKFATNIPSIPEYNAIYKRKESGELVCGFFARVCQKKNLLYAINVLKKVKRKVLLNVYGVIEENEYWEECQKAIEVLPGNISVEYKGAYKHEDVFKLMRQNDVMFFPTLSENYGHVIAEGLFSGLPVMISDQTPWNGINQAECGIAVPLADEDAFVKCIEVYAAMDEQQFAPLREKAIGFATEASDLEGIKKTYMDMLVSTIKLKDKR